MNEQRVTTTRYEIDIQRHTNEQQWKIYTIFVAINFCSSIGERDTGTTQNNAHIAFGIVFVVAVVQTQPKQQTCHRIRYHTDSSQI